MIPFKRVRLLFLFLFLFSSTKMLAQQNNSSSGVDPHSEKALQQTLQMLNDPQQRMKAVNQSPQAQKAHQQALDLAGNEENLGEIYNLSGQLLQNVAKDANGDPQKMREALQKAMRDPAAFAQSLTPAQKQQLKKLADDIERTKGLKGERH